MTDDRAEEIRKEMFAWFGSAAYFAQCFERSLVVLLILENRLAGRVTSHEEVDKLRRDLSKQTLGTLIRKFRKHSVLSDGVVQELSTRLEKRNYLMHDFFYDHAVEITSDSGCFRATEVLKALTQEMELAHVSVQLMTRSLLGAAGWDLSRLDELVRVEMERMKSAKGSRPN